MKSGTVRAFEESNLSATFFEILIKLQIPLQVENFQYD